MVKPKTFVCIRFDEIVSESDQYGIIVWRQCFNPRRVPRWRRFGNWLLVASPLTLGLVVLFFATFNPATAGAGLGVGGLT